MEIPELIKLLAGNDTHNDIKIYQAEVLAYDGTTATATVRTISGPEIDMEVSLMTEIGDGFILLPTVGSIVYIMVNPTVNPFIIHYGEIDGIIADSINGIQFRSNIININGADFGGLIKIQELTDKINILENALNNLITLYNSHIHPAATPNTGPTPSVDTDVIQITLKEDLENPDVTHGGAK